jgi:acyl-coenzyme A thioesterase PaaI-like protein
MAISPFKTFIFGEVLTASDLNSSFTQITNNGEDVPFPSTKAVDFDGQRLILDQDGDTSITADTDDQIDIEIAGADDFNFTVNAFNVLSGSAISLNGVGTILLDADGDLILSSPADNVMQLGLVDVGAQGPTFRFFHDSSSPALADITGDIEFDGRSSTAVQRTYAAIRGVINDPTNALEDGQIEFRGLTGGTDRTMAQLRSYSLGQQFEAGTVFWAGPTATGLYEWSTGSDPGGTGHMALDSAGRLFIGDTASRTINALDMSLQITGTATADSSLSVQRFSANAGQAELFFGKSRGVTIGDYSIVQDNDIIARVGGFAADGVDMATEPARIQLEIDDAAPTANSIGGAIVFFTAAGVGADDIAEVGRFAGDGSFFARFGIRYVGPVDQSSSGGIELKMGRLDAAFISGTDAFVGVHNTGGPGTTAGDLIFAPRSNVNTAIRMFTGNPTLTEQLILEENGTVSGGAIATIAEADAGTAAVLLTPVGLEETRKRQRATSTTATTSETLVPGTHSGTTRRYTAGTAVVVTVDTGWTEGDWVILIQDGVGQVQLAEGTATIAKPSDRNRNTRVQESIICLIFSAAGASHVGGDLEPV